jgi:hypothetical protein
MDTSLTEYGDRMTADDAPDVKIGVRLNADPDALGEWLADGAAFDTAGVDALWIDGGSRLDPVALAAALAAATARATVVLTLDAPTADLDRGVETVRRLSHGRLAVATGVGAAATDSGAADEVAARVPDVPILRKEPDGSGWIDERAEAGELARWLPAPLPEDRAAWRQTRAGAAARGAYGLVLPAGPLLLDMLRNPDDPGGCRDLRLAQG